MVSALPLVETYNVTGLNNHKAIKNDLVDSFVADDVILMILLIRNAIMTSKILNNTLPKDSKNRTFGIIIYATKGVYL